MSKQKLIDLTEDGWMNRKWRPMMALMYFFVCIFDFIIFPILWSLLQAHFKGSIIDQWDPLTLQGAGFFHMAMGAVLGIAAWSRGQEKIATINAISTPPTPQEGQENGKTQ